MIEATPNHAFYIHEKGWIEAGDIEVGDYVTLQSGEVVAVEKVVYTVLETPIKVYNFTVEGLHNYYVGELEILVHNTCPGNGGGDTDSFWSKLKTSVTKKINVSKISYNPKDDVFKRGFNEQSVSYQRTYYGQNGKFNSSQEPIVVYDIGNGNYMMQNGHHRLKAAQDLNLQTIKVDQIISYSEAVRLGITNLPINQMPK